ncbi:hypothetical protein F3Y22_tig00013808pilonHSYRG00101 [Hibiscus syriacus]|uniref:NADP-dependent oxidoreductase domain-containing protein n=1 Tax=Hibiscus syriacus TaxID=106335 RepID=A0A6A3C0Q8_HIBSY|nr:hypothetical protein F3Y22_tig00013808pilonHSYRG00101 [Hibiscus syriacus]
MDSSSKATCFRIPEQVFPSSGRRMQRLGFGTGAYPPVTPEPLGQAIVEAISSGLVKSRDELFITSKLWCSDAYGDLVLPALNRSLHDAYGDLVLPALNRSLQNLKLEYLDLYLIHWPVTLKRGRYDFGVRKEEIFPMDSAPYGGMQPDVEPKEGEEYCKANGIIVIGYSPLGAYGTLWGNKVIENEMLKEIAEAKGKTVAQICLRWAFEEGVGVIVKSFNGERMKHNLEIFDWS